MRESSSTPETGGGPSAARLAGHGLGCLFAFAGTALTTLGVFFVLGTLSADPVGAALFESLAPPFLFFGLPTLVTGIVLGRRARPQEPHPSGKAGAVENVVGTLLSVAGMLSLLFLGALVALALVGTMEFRADVSSLPLVCATFGTIGVLGLTAGRKLARGKPVWVASVRRLLGILVL